MTREILLTTRAIQCTTFLLLLRVATSAFAADIEPFLLFTSGPVGLAPGETNLVIFDDLGDAVAEYDLVVIGEVSRHVTVHRNVEVLTTFSCEPRCTEVASGARNVDNILNRSLLPELSAEFLSAMAGGKAIESVYLGLNDDGTFSYTIA